MGKVAVPNIRQLFWYSAKSSIAKEEYLATSPQLATWVNMPHPVVVRLQVVALASETVDLFCVWTEAYFGQ